MKEIRDALTRLYEHETEMLKQFRNSIINKHEHLRYEATNKRNYIDEMDFFSLDAYDYDNFAIGLEEAVDIFNLLGLSLNSVEIENEIDEVSDFPYQFIKYKDFCNIVFEKDELDFFIFSVELIQLKLKQKNLLEFQSIIKSTLKNLSIKLPNFKQSVFIAMSFDDELKDIRKAISTVVKNEGLTPLVIDSKEHNNQIVPEIFNEIDKAKFVIADLTHHKAGVYYEAGYAKGKDKEVIFTCRKSDFDKRHFDVAQTNTIVWETAEELSNRLAKRIEAMTMLSM